MAVQDWKDSTSQEAEAGGHYTLEEGGMAEREVAAEQTVASLHELATCAAR
jgi:hypothetical protein